MTRRKLLDRLAGLPHDIEPSLEVRLDDERWYVQRNMLVLFERRHTAALRRGAGAGGDASGRPRTAGSDPTAAAHARRTGRSGARGS